MNAVEANILRICAHAVLVRKEVISHLVFSLNSWQDGHYPNCGAQQEAEDWFAIQRLQTEALETERHPNYCI